MRARAAAGATALAAARNFFQGSPACDSPRNVMIRSRVAGRCSPEGVGVVHAEELARREEQARAALREDVAGLGRLEARVDGDEHGAGGLQADRREDPLVAVRCPDRDAIAGLDARREKGARGFEAGGGQLCEGQPDRTLFDRRALAKQRRGPGDELRNRGDRGDRASSRSSGYSPPVLLSRVARRRSERSRVSRPRARGKWAILRMHCAQFTLYADGSAGVASNRDRMEGLRWATRHPG